jgi:hypothetical protein
MLEDPLFWVFVLPGLLLGLYAQSRIKLNIVKYSQVRVASEDVVGREAERPGHELGQREILITEPCDGWARRQVRLVLVLALAVPPRLSSFFWRSAHLTSVIV